MLNVFVSRKLPGNVTNILKSSCNVTVFPHERNITKEELLEYVSDQDGIITMLTDPVDQDVIRQGSKLKAIANYAVGFNNIDIDEATRQGIAVINTPDVLTEASADLAWALLMSTARRVIEGDTLTRAGEFAGWAPELLLGQEISGQTLGIIGAGRIGQAVAKRALGFGMKVFYHNRSQLDPTIESELNITYTSLENLLSQSDFISLHCPLTPDTYHLIGEEELQQMKTTAILINTARGPVVDEKALVKALKDRVIFGAGLDVFEDEPALAPGLAVLPNVVLTPHIASASTKTRIRMAEMVSNDVLAVLNGNKPRNIVNPKIYK